ncbi:SGNH/GDSL hydrolase family protein [Pedobacter sp. L105]|uniref:SGNH/GDSL hydrolase family protein n=1 Tax=Pedobacter sp. L105 TaxID=1641871 RepID=UPI00131CE9A3|nr:SGNH/GDSL hydrolase family protein [Pedobacter sp. L105]
MKIKLILAIILLSFTSFKPFETTWTAIGDSITYLNDHLNETGNRVSKGYLTRTVEKLPNIKYINQGHNGWTAIRIAREIDKLGLTKTDIYSVLLGTNDWWAGLPLGTLDDYKNNTGLNTVCGAYRIIINKIKTLNPEAKIILLTPLQRGDFVYVADSHNNATGSYDAKNGQLLSQFADAVNQIGSYEHVKVVDLFNKSGINTGNVVKFKMLKDPLRGNYKKYKYPDYKGVAFDPATDDYPYPVDAMNYTYDGLHPSDKGNEIIASLLAKKIREN